MAGIVLLAAGGAAAYLVAQPSASQRGHPLPSRVLSFRAVGLVTEQARAGAAPGSLLQLLGQRNIPRFSTLPPGLAAAGTPQWTADLMADDSYIFIFLPTDRCLTATGPADRARLALRHCDLGAGQRWRRASGLVAAEGHDFYEYASMSDGDCLTQPGTTPGQLSAAALTRCVPGRPASQLIAFWWG